MPSATIAIFAYGDVKGDTVACLVEEIRQAPDLGFWVVQNDASLWRSKSRLMTTFLDNPDAGDVLVTIDRDIVWKPGDVSNLVEKCRGTEGIVSGMYPKRAFGQGLTADFMEPGSYTTGTDQLVMARSVPGGFLAIHRKAIEKTIQGMERTTSGYLLCMPTVLNGFALEEDCSFCNLARAVGVSIDIWLGANLHHIGSFEFRIIDSSLEPPADEPIEIVKHSKILSDLPEDIKLFTGVDNKTMKANMERSRQRLSELWDEPTDETEWYNRPAVSHAYLFDLAQWHLDGASVVISEYCKGITGKRVLDYGAGIGTWALTLAEQGNHVEYVEVQDYLDSFIQFRAKPRGLSVNRIERPRGQYDMAVVWHVLEHVSDPQAVATEVAGSLAPGGRLLTQSDFQKGLFHPQHHELPPDVTPDSFWEKAGLVKTGVNEWSKMMTDNGNNAVSVEQLMSGEPLPDSAFLKETAPTRYLTTVQRIALVAAQRDVQVARRALELALKTVREVMAECDLDPERQYDIAADGLVVVKGK